MCLTQPCTIAFFAKHRVHWKERFHLFPEDTLLSNFLSQRYATKNPNGGGWGRFCTQNCIKNVSKNHKCERPKSCSLVASWRFNPFTPESNQCQNSPAASQEIWHHTVWRTWLFIAYSDEKWLYYKFSLHHSYNRFLKGWENTLFELRSERVNQSSFVNSYLRRQAQGQLRERPPGAGEATAGTAGPTEARAGRARPQRSHRGGEAPASKDGSWAETPCRAGEAAAAAARNGTRTGGAQEEDDPAEAGELGSRARLRWLVLRKCGLDVTSGWSVVIAMGMSLGETRDKIEKEEREGEE